jgi:small subunit ribosomal protein S20
MAHHKSAIRQERRSIRRAAVNKKNKTALRSQVKKVRESIKDADKEGAMKLIPETYAAADKSVKKRTVHANKAARIKSRLSRQAAKIAAK